MLKRWVRLRRVWKTEEAYQVLNLLRGERIRARTIPDEFNGDLGNRRMMFTDPERLWAVFVRANQAEQAVTLLRDERLLPGGGDSK